MTGPEHSQAKRRCRAYTEMAANGQEVDNSGSTLQKLFQLYRQADLCDVQLQVGVHLFQAHKLILSMSSDVFKTMLTDAKWPDARKARIVLNEEPECVKVFGEFLKYMYSGSIHLNTTSVLPVLTLADKYNIHDLGKVCKQYMASHCHDSLDNLKVVSWLQYAILCNDHALESTVRRYIVLNFNHVMESEDFLTMRQETLEEVLHCKQLVIHSEYSLFVGLKRWLMHNTGISPVGKQSQAKQLAEKKMILQVLSHIRLPLMKRSQLLFLQSDPFVQRHANFFFPKLHAAWVFHRYPHCKDRFCMGAVIDSVETTKDSQHLHVQSAESKKFSNPRSPGSRTVPRRNSDSSIVCPSKGSSDLSQKAVISVSKQLCVVDPEGSMSSAEIDTGRHLQHQVKSYDCMMDSSAGSPTHHIIPSSSRGSSAYIMPRNYTCDDWSTCLAIENFARFPRYGSHTYFFSTPTSPVPSSPSSANRCHHNCLRQEENDDSTMLEWQAELYPKGVHFPQAKMIGIPKSYDIDENCQEVVRLAVNSKTHHQEPCRVDISVLAVAIGTEDGSEYIEALAHKTCIFDREHTMHNIDNIVSFAELNRARSKYLTESVVVPGSGQTCFKVVVIIKPTH